MKINKNKIKTNDNIERNSFSFVNLTTKEIDEILDVPYRDKETKAGLFHKLKGYFNEKKSKQIK